MRFPSRRAVVLSTMVLAAGTVAGLAWAARDEIETRWICYQLKNCAEAERKPYLARIVKECRVGAIPTLLQILGWLESTVQIDAAPGDRYKVRFERPVLALEDL